MHVETLTKLVAAQCSLLVSELNSFLLCTEILTEGFESILYN